MNVFIALAKGELGKEIEKYLQNYGLYVKLDGRPLQFVQRVGESIFRPMQSKDVPWYVAEKADYGITGEDISVNYNLGNANRIKTLEKLGFGKADLVIFARNKADELKRTLKRTPTVAVPNYYKNLLELGEAGEYLRNTFEGFETKGVDGSTEGFVTDGTADLGFDLTTYFQKLPEERRKTTIEANELIILERIMPTEAVVVSRNSTEFTTERYEKILNGYYELDWKKMQGLLPAITQDADTGEILMLAYVNQNALQRTMETGLATFWSRTRQELWTKGLTSGNTMKVEEINYDCDGDALTYKVKPNGPACHTGERNCFYRALWRRN